MNAQAPTRGRHLVEPKRGRRDRLIAAPFHKILDRIDAGLAQGSIEAHLPDGSVRVLGGRGAGPMVVVTISKWRTFWRLAHSGSVGWYEGWAAGEWSSPDPVTIFDLFMRNRLTLGATARAKGLSRIAKRVRHALRANHRAGAKRNILAHYDLGNDFYAAWLDPTMTYSSAVFSDGDTLAAAQRRKIDAIAARIGNARSVLEIGCGWGSLAKAIAARGATVTAISLSPSQLVWARANATPGVTFEECDYRDVTGCYDAIVSVEMVEAVGQRNWPVFLNTVAGALKPGGHAAIQFIAIADDIFERYAASADFIQTYIFPGGMLMSQSRFRALAEARGLRWTDQFDFGCDYADTLKHWRIAFDDAVNTGQLANGFDEKFVALWRYYLMYCEGGFRGGGIQVSQVTLIKGES
jgi:cyclopropane-fatty-acyl-phospholipid synthase